MPPKDFQPIESIEIFGGSDALLVQDVIPWMNDSNRLALEELGISYDLIRSSTLNSLDYQNLKEYKFIIYSSDQPTSYYQNIANNIEKIEKFVEKGGLLIAHVCDAGWNEGDWRELKILPKNVKHITGWDDWNAYSQDLQIADSNHPIITGSPLGTINIYEITPNYFDNWGYSTHGFFIDLPEKTKVINLIESGIYAFMPTYIDYNYGIGKVLATMQPAEWGYFSGSQWWCGNRPELLRNELRFAKRIFPEEAAKLVNDENIIGKDYVWGSKGFKNIDGNFQFLTSEEIKGLDCSGLSFWAYNRAYYGDREIKPSCGYVKNGKCIPWEELTTEEKKEWKENLWEILWENRPMYYFGANGQRRWNTKSVEKDDLMPGDLLFFDWNSDGKAEHVEMYVGEFFYSGGIIRGNEYPAGMYNVVRAYGDETHNYGIVPDKLNNRVKLKGFMGFGRVTDHIVAMKIVGGSPIDLIVTDPDGEILTKEIGDTPSMEYMEYDIDGDGNLNDVIASGERKLGDYIIQVVPEIDASPTDTYSLIVTANGQTIFLAENVPISEIPERPYIIRSTETEIIPNQPPVALCKNVIVNADATCHGSASIDNGSYDPDGDPITIVQNPAGPYSLGSTTVTLTVTDSFGASSSCMGTVTVVDVTPPNIESITASLNLLWPPNHKMVPVSVNVSSSDNCDAEPYCRITSASSNEPENGLGDGDTAPDWKITGDFTVDLRAERPGKGDVRVYTITVMCADDSGNNSTGTTIVTVPHDQRKK